MSDPARELAHRHHVHQVSLRGASTKEITRDALLHRVSFERELRSYQRRVSAAARMELFMNHHDALVTCTWISANLLRPFLLFSTHSSGLRHMLYARNTKQISFCFTILLKSIDSAEPEKNFCSLAVRKSEEKGTWLYQAKKLVSLCSFILAECDPTEKDEEKAQLTALGMRLVISLTDPVEWKIINSVNNHDADVAVNNLIRFMITTKCGLYKSVRRYITKLDANDLARNVNGPAGGYFLVTASAITLALRPFCLRYLEPGAVLHFILTIPYLTQRLPPLLLPALRHQSSLLPCLKVPLSILKFPPSAGFLANVISLTTEYADDSGTFINGLDIKIYTHTINHLSEIFLEWIESNGLASENDEDEDLTKGGNSIVKMIPARGSLNVLHRVANFISIGPLPILNMLSFTPGFTVKLWELLEGLIFSHNAFSLDANEATRDRGGSCNNEEQTIISKASGNKWVNVLAKIAGKSCDADVSRLSNGDVTSSQIFEDAYEFWDIESLKQGCQGISKELQCILYLFCSVYAHLLLVLDDIEFYEKQVPFTLSRQQRISSVLNTFVYGSFTHNCSQNNQLLIDAADSRHKFCPPSLWVAPASRSRLPIPAAARSHEALSSNPHCRDASGCHRMSSVISTIPHVFPFEERVQMFREFIKLDKDARRAAGELTGPGPGSIEIVVRRDHIVEDGFKQLNFLGSRLKSCFNISFVSESGLPEAGLDYGGLSKEFLTDIAKAAFEPKYGFFCQTSTSEGFLVPNTSARFLENGIEMIEFLGRMVGKALYEGILLEYCFSLPFVQKLVGRYSFLDELSTLDPELYKNLIYIKNYDGDVKELALDFTIAEDLCGKRIVTELRPGGKCIPVTNENKLQYVYAVADYKLNRQVSTSICKCIFRGLIDLISPSWLNIFTAKEFNQLLSGGKHDFDVEDLKSNTKYTGGYSEGSRTVKFFWEVAIKLHTPEQILIMKKLRREISSFQESVKTNFWQKLGGSSSVLMPVQDYRFLYRLFLSAKVPAREYHGKKMKESRQIGNSTSSTAEFQT
ncbi:unnamed protein product [Spirodela intermedia]|uniref:HECT-type E3 ubiquitin transferase n=1 Tax=Spirodela intermedia TaxID=51605 RepID=A0A7I8IY08_SPIIN|nr:unnamed protein product [Spirodela intermedia]CAA6662747.1 unnamed protein product [Spirodela intermedia]